MHLTWWSFFGVFFLSFALHVDLYLESTQQWPPDGLSSCCWQTWQREGKGKGKCGSQTQHTHLDRYLWWPAAERGDGGVKVTETHPHLRWEDDAGREKGELLGLAGGAKGTQRLEDWSDRGGGGKTRTGARQVVHAGAGRRLSRARRSAFIVRLGDVWATFRGSSAYGPAARGECRCHKINVGAAREKITKINK